MGIYLDFQNIKCSKVLEKDKHADDDGDTDDKDKLMAAAMGV